MGGSVGQLTSDELTTLQDAFGRLLSDQCTEQHVRQWMEDRSGFDDGLWQAISAMGITGLLVAEEFGGSGAGPIEVERIMEQAGGALLGAPLLSSAIMSVAAVQASGDDAAMSRLLPELAAGSLIATLLVTGGKGSWDESGVDLQATAAADGWRLTGTAEYVLHGRSAQVWLALAHTPEGLALFEVSSDAERAICTALPSFDHTLLLDRIELADTPATLIGKLGQGWAYVQAALELGVVALAGEQAGGAQKILDITVDYAKIRHQFGRPIGSFQAIKHMAADLVLEVESAISAARKAAAAASEDAEDADVWRNLAGFACADAYVRTSADAVQMHGGIAFTWEHPAHLYLRRARADAQIFGTSAQFREQYLQALGG